SEEIAAQGMARSVGYLNAFLDKVLEDEGVTASELIVFGFSQGTMLCLQVAPRRADCVAAIVGFSGRLIHPETLIGEVVSKPPVLLVHGDQDEVVAPQSLDQAAAAMSAAGFDVYTHTMKGTGHGIAPDGLNVALAFMREKLAISDT
ncbi:MAG: alpha/beta hydrolase, partial [Halocynthiibacter sp.]